MRLGDTLHDRKSQSRAAGTPAIAAPEALEDQLALVVGYAGSLVENVHQSVSRFK